MGVLTSRSRWLRHEIQEARAKMVTVDGTLWAIFSFFSDLVDRKACMMTSNYHVSLIFPPVAQFPPVVPPVVYH